ncbi:hypothetical protein DXT91_28605 [Agrobacterium tumefaciens]|nr:hypothetical protein [Agrobacterium tumefaciens]
MAVVVMVLILIGLGWSAALRCNPGRRRDRGVQGARCKGDRDGGGSPGLHKRIEAIGESEDRTSARKAGETVPVERQRSLAPRRGAEPPSNHCIRTLIDFVNTVAARLVVEHINVY